ncbi:outer membrane protein transport protein [Burkholderia multivorans]|uniref:OmpP1/FadL family transporter n=1 Tax=Burkholderia multivorans TaxID=87883 RepID=UPI000CFFEC4E|nr:outer membrane protein transport protein [Burkholderia multivorans]MBU9312579.1 outer membrane protein transport protein [Burkholderia multivorans]MCA8251500.1 outer membrane protein transport protein [Burkholderia multivorans]MCA8457292.1 outer membrane protein transport protein [Burkholderia multivorans]MDN7870426.1 outer membrane protein transport protein [Burkholderia multivorans]PRH13699.1 aromatic hydrocarbon degradation protein [Burkholderia multivorans]
MKRKYVAVATGCLVATLSGETAWATDAFNLVGHGPVSIGMGGTAAAYDIGPAGMMANPATLTFMPDGTYFLLGADMVSADVKVTNMATGETANSYSRGRNNGPYFGPEFAFVWRKDRIALGVGAYATDGVGTQYGTGSFLSRTATNDVNTGLDVFSRLLVMDIPFSIAYKVTDKLTVGGSVDAVWTSVNLGLLLDTTQIGALAAQGRLSGGLVPALLGIPQLSGGYLNFNNGKLAGGAASAWGIGGRLGLTYALNPTTRVGLAYQFKTSVGDLSGHSTLTAVSALAGNIPLSGTVRLHDFQMPAAFTAGISHDFTDRFTVAVDYQRVFWSGAMKDIQVGFTQDGTGQTLKLALPFNYRDINVFSIGGQYRYSESWTFRAGFHYAQEATPDAGLMAILPATPTTNVTAGTSYSFNENTKLDVALAYAFPKTFTNESLPDTSVPIKVRHSQIAASLAFTKRF